MRADELFKKVGKGYSEATIGDVGREREVIVEMAKEKTVEFLAELTDAAVEEDVQLQDGEKRSMALQVAVIGAIGTIRENIKSSARKKDRKEMIVHTMKAIIKNLEKEIENASK